MTAKPTLELKVVERTAEHADGIPADQAVTDDRVVFRQKPWQNGGIQLEVGLPSLVDPKLEAELVHMGDAVAVGRFSSCGTVVTFERWTQLAVALPEMTCTPVAAKFLSLRINVEHPEEVASPPPLPPSGIYVKEVDGRKVVEIPVDEMEDFLHQFVCAGHFHEKEARLANDKCHDYLYRWYRPYSY